MFSVIIPAYNCAETIKNAIDSVLNQTRLDLIEEIIVVNDGSSDDTETVLKKYIDEYKKQNGNVEILLYSHSNKGVSYTRNRGIRLAKAEWIALLDSDDVWLENKIERQMYFIDKKSDILFMGAVYPLRFFGKSKEGLYKLNARELCIRNMPQTSSVIFRKDKGIKYGLFDENMQYGEDINFFQKFLLDDSYYVLAEKLTQLGIQKNVYGESGLSSNFVKMHKGRNRNVKELQQYGLINKPFMYCMLILDEIKLIRRIVIRIFQTLIHRSKRY